MQLRFTYKAYCTKLLLVIVLSIELWKWKLLLNAVMTAKVCTKVTLGHFFAFPLVFWLLANVAAILGHE